MQEGVVAGEVFEGQNNPMEVKETIGDGGGANSQSFDQNRQDAISRVSALQNSAKGSN